MKKSILLLTVMLLATMMLSACGEKQDETISVAGLKGPTTMGMVKMLSDDAALGEEAKYDFLLAGSADEITPGLLRGEIDLAAIPSNLASVLYNQSQGEIQVLAVNTLGVVYIMTNERLNGEPISVTDLKGKTIYATGKGSAPEYYLDNILTSYGLEMDKDVYMDWRSEPTEIVSLMQTAADNHETIYVMIPQPFTTAALNQVTGFNIVLDLTNEWIIAEKGNSPVTGVLVGNKEFVEDNEEAVEEFLKAYEESINYVNSHEAEAAALIEEYGIVKAAIAETAIPYCNLTYLDGAKMKVVLSKFYEVLLKTNESSVGGAVPGDDFYYEP